MEDENYEQENSEEEEDYNQMEEIEDDGEVNVAIVFVNCVTTSTTFYCCSKIIK